MAAMVIFVKYMARSILLIQSNDFSIFDRLLDVTLTPHVSQTGKCRLGVSYAKKYLIRNEPIWWDATAQVVKTSYNPLFKKNPTLNQSSSAIVFYTSEVRNPSQTYIQCPSDDGRTLATFLNRFLGTEHRQFILDQKIYFVRCIIVTLFASLASPDRRSCLLRQLKVDSAKGIIKILKSMSISIIDTPLRTVHGGSSEVPRWCAEIRRWPPRYHPWSFGALCGPVPLRFRVPFADISANMEISSDYRTCPFHYTHAQGVSLNKWLTSV